MGEKLDYYCWDITQSPSIVFLIPFKCLFKLSSINIPIFICYRQLQLLMLGVHPRRYSTGPTSQYSTNYTATALIFMAPIFHEFPAFAILFSLIHSLYPFWVHDTFNPCRVPVGVTLILYNGKAIGKLHTCMGTAFTSQRHRWIPWCRILTL